MKKCVTNTRTYLTEKLINLLVVTRGLQLHPSQVVFFVICFANPRHAGPVARVSEHVPIDQVAE